MPGDGARASIPFTTSLPQFLVTAPWLCPVSGGISQNVVWYVVKGCCERAGLEHIAPHDLRRTCAKLCHSSGGELEQIQFLLGMPPSRPRNAISAANRISDIQ